MHKLFITFAFLLCAAGVVAQGEEDPVVMVIAGEAVPRSEFEYSYNKNNSEGVIDKKDLDEYVDLFINYKLKVKAAAEAQIDTLSSFQVEFASYRDQQIRPTMIDDDDIEREARRIYRQTQQQIDSAGGMVKPAHILILVPQGASDEQAHAAKERADSIYAVLRAAAFDKEVFADLAATCSDDKNTAPRGGELSWFRRGLTFPEFDECVYNMSVGETSAPVKTPAGYHIIQLRDKGPFFSYDSLRTSVLEYMDQRGVRNFLINQKLDSLAQAQGEDVTPAMILAQKREQLEAADPDIKYLIKEYHDGLMLYEISNQKVWGFAERDTIGLENYFARNKKRYKWGEPRFKGIAYRTKEAEDIDNVRKAIEALPFDEWNEMLRTTFNSDSVLRIRVEKGIFQKGDNAIVDTYEFHLPDSEIKELKGYPFTATYGRIIKQPESYADVRGYVVADYQEELEKQWIAELRATYPVEVDTAVLATVNQH